MSVSEKKKHSIHNLFDYEVILTADSSKCSYLVVLKAYVNRIGLLL